MRSSPSPPSRATISCRACAATASPSWAAGARHGRSSSARRRSRATHGSARCSWIVPRRAHADRPRRREGDAHTRMAQTIVHLVDGTYELFRQFYGRRRFSTGEDEPFGAVVGVLHSVLEMIEKGATDLGVAADQV